MIFPALSITRKHPFSYPICCLSMRGSRMMYVDIDVVEDLVISYSMFDGLVY